MVIQVLETVTKEEKKGKSWPCAANTSSVWHTGLSSGAPDSVRCARLASGELAALGKKQRCMAIIHRTVWWRTGLSGEPTVASARPKCPVCTGQCPVRQPTPRTNGRMRQIWKEIAHRTATVIVRWCTGLSGAPPDRRQVWPSKLASNGS
jgi:hypothetical protein